MYSVATVFDREKIEIEQWSLTGGIDIERIAK
jgi:hypothetical protein